MTDTRTITATPTTGRWTVDPVRCTAAFTVRAFGLVRVRGRIPVELAYVDVDPDGTVSALYADLDLNGIDTGIAKRDKDLRKPALLDIDRHPTMRFESSGICRAADGWVVSGYLSVRGGRSLVQLAVAEPSMVDNEVRATATTRLDRTTPGIRAPRFMIGRYVDVTIDAVLRPPQ